MIIRTIEAEERGKQRLRAAAYARVSREDERLSHSLAAQIRHYAELAAEEDWEFAGVYSDAFVSGTTAGREGFRALIGDCLEGRIDLVLVKSVSRFSRNTVDLLEACRLLSRSGVEIRFEKEGLSTATAEGEVMLSLLASFAQEESRSISENVKWGVRKGFEAGRFPKRRVFGYMPNAGGFEIVPGEAERVPLVFEAYASGESTGSIAARLSLSTAAVFRMLGNECYTGSKLLQKEFIEDHLTHRRRKNRGELPKYLAEGSHPALISRELFEAAAAERARRAELGWRSELYQKGPFTGKLFCGECGASLRRHTKRAADGGRRSPGFLCKRRSRLGSGACCLRRVAEHELVRAAGAASGQRIFPETLAPSISSATVYNDRFEITLADGRFFSVRR